MKISKDEKIQTYRRLYKKIRHLCEYAESFEDIANFNKEYIAAVQNGELFKADAKIIDKSIVEAERWLKYRKLA